MLSRIKNHPFNIEAFFDYSLVLTFAVPKEELQHLLPPCLELDTYNDKLGFIAVALVQTKNLRPKGFNSFFGNDFFLIGYRLFVKYNTNQGKRLRGLYILKSETDKKKMEILGNLFTHYHYSTIDIQHSWLANTLSITSQKADFSITAMVSDNYPSLPPDSPFIDWKEAKRFSGPLPFTFTWLPKTSEVLIVQGVREHWIPKPVTIKDFHFSFLDSLKLKNIVLANSFIIENIPYSWKEGIIEKWSPQESLFKEY